MHTMLTQEQQMTVVGTIGLGAIPPSAAFCRFLWIRPFKSLCQDEKYLETDIKLTLFFVSTQLFDSKNCFMVYSDESSDDDQKGAFKPVPKLRGRKGFDEKEEYERQLREREEEEELERVGMGKVRGCCTEMVV